MTIIVTQRIAHFTKENPLKVQNTIKKLRANLGLMIAYVLFGATYAIPKMISAPSTALALLALAYAGSMIFWIMNFLKWKDEALRDNKPNT